MDNQRFILKLDQLEKNLLLWDDIIPEKEIDYLSNKKTQLATERLLQICIEIVLDLCAMLVQHEHLGPPTDEDNIFDLLAVKLKTIKNIKEMKRFRNVLVHRYGDVDNHKVFENAQNGKHDFTLIINEMRKLLSNSMEK